VNSVVETTVQIFRHDEFVEICFNTCETKIQLYRSSECSIRTAEVFKNCVLLLKTDSAVWKMYRVIKLQISRKQRSSVDCETTGSHGGNYEDDSLLGY
jgi:hypothetical protein